MRRGAAWGFVAALGIAVAACTVTRTETKRYEPGRFTPSVETEAMTVDWKPEVISLPLGAALAYCGADWMAVLAVTFPSAVSKLLMLPVTAVDNMTTTAATAAREGVR